MSLYVETIPKRNSLSAILLRESIRRDGKIRRRTLANLSRLPPDVVEAIRLVLKGGQAGTDPSEVFAVRRALPHGNVCAVLGVSKQLGLPGILHRRASRERDLALAAIAARLLHPASKLATARQLSPETSTSSLGAVLGLGSVSGNEMLTMLDWLLKRQPWIEQSLANRHLGGGTLVLYDVSPSDVGGQCSFRLLCAGDGCPVAVEVFGGGTENPPSFVRQAAWIRDRFRIHRLVLLGDWGMLTTARICKDQEPAMLERILALQTTDIRRLLKTRHWSDLEMLLDPQARSTQQVGEIDSPDFPQERLMVFFNPRLREAQARKRERQLRDTEAILEDIARKIHRRGSRLRGRDRIKRRIERLPKRHRVEENFDITASDNMLAWSRNTARIAAETRLNGIYIVRTRPRAGMIEPSQAVEPYKSFSYAESLFRSLQGHLKVHPIHVYSTDHVRAHVFLCMLAYYLEWHIHKRLAPMWIAAGDLENANVRLATAERAKRKTKRSDSDMPVCSLGTVLTDLATLTWKEAVLPSQPNHPFPLIAEPTPLQADVFRCLGIKLRDMIPATGHH